MSKIPDFAGLSLLALLSGVTLPAHAATPESPAVVELFTSQGCSSCPPANANLAALADRPDVLALSFGVTYWDSLGWKDTFAQPQFTTRQADYERGLGHDASFTPQIVVNGRADTVGNDRSKIEKLIANARNENEPALRFADNSVIVDAAEGSAQVWLVRYEPRIIQVPVSRGENSGVTLPHRNVVRTLEMIGNWNGTQTAYNIPAADNGLATAILLQKGKGGEIIAAAKQPPSS